MNEKYYLAIFSENTWNEFLEKGSSVYGTNLNKQKRMEATKPGDFLICYITKLSRFVGLLEITSEAYIENSSIWKSDIYPVRVDVHPIYILKAREGIPVLELKEELSMFDNLKDKNIWGCLFRTSMNKFSNHDAKIIIEKLKIASNKKFIKELT